MQFYLQDSGGAKYSVWDNIQSKIFISLNVNNKHCPVRQNAVTLMFALKRLYECRWRMRAEEVITTRQKIWNCSTLHIYKAKQIHEMDCVWKVSLGNCGSFLLCRDKKILIISNFALT